MNKTEIDKLSNKIIGYAIDVHRISPFRVLTDSLVVLGTIGFADILERYFQLLAF